jgi:hypothetical protein
VPITTYSFIINNLGEYSIKSGQNFTRIFVNL